jgi:Hemin uptake protein hemP
MCFDHNLTQAKNSELQFQSKRVRIRQLARRVSRDGTHASGIGNEFGRTALDNRDTHRPQGGRAGSGRHAPGRRFWAGGVVSPGCAPASSPGREPDAPSYDARVLTGGGLVAVILLDGQSYTLRITRAGKLILTK